MECRALQRDIIREELQAVVVARNRKIKAELDDTIISQERRQETFGGGCFFSQR
jgi:hypothetical protein